MRVIGKEKERNGKLTNGKARQGKNGQEEDSKG